MKIVPLKTFSSSTHAGVLNSYSAEYDAVNVAINNISSLNNVSIILQKFNSSTEVNLFSQGKNIHAPAFLLLCIIT